jgi:hypothetical protein
MTAGQKSAIETRKNGLLMKAEARAQSRVKGDPVKGIEPEPSEVVFAELEEEKQRIQNAYEGEIAAATGGDPGHFEYPEPAPKPPTPKPSTGGRGPQAPAAPSYPKTESEARQRATAAGKDPDLYVQALRQRGLLK